MELATGGAFSITAAALKTQPAPPQWSLLAEQFSVRCDCGRLEFDLGAIGKGFALDRMAEILREWDCPTFLLVAGGSSILAGDAPPGTPGWSCGLGDDICAAALLAEKLFLERLRPGGEGTTYSGSSHRSTGGPTKSRLGVGSTAAESDALSTAAMVLDEAEVSAVILSLNNSWVWLHDGPAWKQFGNWKGIDEAPPRLNTAANRAESGPPSPHNQIL